jgi:lysosomal alpha-mannosidase
MGIMQHHDAITGTERQKVASDYVRILNEGFSKCGAIAETAIK